MTVPVQRLCATTTEPSRIGAVFLRARMGLITLMLCLVWMGSLASGQAWSQENDAATADQQLDTLRKQITVIQKTLASDADLDDATLSKMKSAAVSASTQAATVASSLAPTLDGVQARLAELGPLAPGAKEAPDVAAQRAQLDHNRTALDTQIKLARLLSVEADQASEQATTARRVQLQARLGERTSSILVRPFWSQLRAELPQTGQRLAALGKEIGSSAANTPAAVWGSIVLAMLVLAFTRRWAGRYLLRITSTKVPQGRLRRSVHALMLTLLAIVTPALIVVLLKTGVQWNSTLTDTTARFLNGVVGFVCFGGFVAGLGYALLSPARASWRLPALPDRLAHRMRQFPVIFGTVLMVVGIAERTASLINVGLSTAVAVNCMVALVLGITVALGLLRAERVWYQIRQSETAPLQATPVWLRAGVIVLWLALSASLLSLLVGYVAFGSFIVKQVSWVLVVVCGTYLLTVLVDDVCMLLLSRPLAGEQASEATALRQTRDQAAVLLSGGLRLLCILLALMLLLAPFGEGPGELFIRMNQLRDGLSIGELQIRPGALIEAVLVLMLGLTAVRHLRHWMETRYLPTTNLDAGMQVSALTLFGFVGGILAVASALSAVGIGLERIAWVASALSVGIGFGLQAVVQNFVSGLILLAERPVKVGDWVSLGGVEGDIRRINVRATEIQMGDRSTVIVPNSEFITKIVRNVTHASPLGLVQIKLPLPLDTDAEQARQLILATFVDNSAILDTPAPAVQLDGIENGTLLFNATGFVTSPRLAYGVRSTLLFALLAQLKAAAIPISKPSTILLGSMPLPRANAPVIGASGDLVSAAPAAPV